MVNSSGSDVNESQTNRHKFNKPLIIMRLYHVNPRQVLTTLATRVRARNDKARKKQVHKKSQHFTARNLRQHVFINPKGSKFTIDVDLV